MYERRYYRKLLKLFLSAGTLFVLVITAISAVSIAASQLTQYKNTVRQSAAAHSAVARIGISVIMTALKDITQNSIIDQWGHSVGNASYYYDSVRAFQQICNASAGLSLVEFEMSVSTTDEDTFFITQEGTLSKELFFKTETSLSESQASGIFTHFRESSVPLTIAAYGPDGVLRELYYVSKRTSRYADMLYLVKIPRETLFSRDQDFILLSRQGGFIAGHRNDPQSLAKYQAITASLGGEGGLQEIGGYDVVSDEALIADWKLVYIYDEMRLNWQIIVLLLGGACALLFFVVTQAARVAARRLYAPIDDVVSDAMEVTSDGLAAGGGQLDEFQILKSSSARMRQLSEELRQAVSANSVLVEQQRYQDMLLEGRAQKDDVRLPFCVAVFEFPDEYGGGVGEDSYLDKNRIDAYTREQDGLHYVNVGQNCCAVVLEGGPARGALATVKAIIRQTGDFNDLRAAVSDISQGEKTVGDCYQQALRLLDYKYVYDKAALFTPELVARRWDADYYYPLATEVRLVKCLAEGKEEARDIFRSAIRENIEKRTLTPEATKNFVFAMIGTFLRVFQEIKEAPESLMGEPVDFSSLYGRWNSAKTISELSRILDGVIEFVQKRSSNSDSQLMRGMLDYIHANYQDDIMLSDMAEHFNISAKYCSALFKRLCNDTFKNHLNQYRVQMACALLDKNPGIKISDLSVRVGFNSSNSFIRVFSRYVGMTPKAYADRTGQAT